ncbi:MAG: hypothetical protein ABT11_04265 [Novosphingobium sp. SCN 66-18]|nr:MAG: hypothetical protein ABT11_04265 [Novosphingobium sp. SCN 66-18]
MSDARCQICGRRQHLRKNGLIPHHNVGGERCPGAGSPPIEQTDEHLVAYARAIETAFERACDTVRSLEESRANYIDPALVIRRGLLAGRLLKINRRVHRIRTWPARYDRSMARQMAKFGYAWAEPPPAYLVERHRTFGGSNV